MKLVLKALAWLIVLGGLAALAAWRGYQRYTEKRALASGEAAQGSAAQPRPVLCRRVEAGDLRQIASLTGTIKPMAEVRVMSKVSGRLDELRLEDGAPVELGTVIPRKGMRLAVIDHEGFVAQVQQAEAALASLKAEQAKMEAGARPEELEIARTNVRAAESAVQAARATAAQAQATLRNATSEVERIRNLFKDKVVTQQQLDNAEAQYTIAAQREAAAQEQVRSAEQQLRAALQQLALTQQGARREDREALAAKVRQAEAGLRQAQIALDESSIEAPMAGVVSRKDLDEGNLVSPGVAIVTIVQVDTVKVMVGVGERELSLLREGKTKATVTVDAYGGEAFEGTVQKISPVVDERTRTVEVEVHIPNPDRRLKPGMFTRVGLLLREKKGVPTIPEHAILWQEDEPFVVVVNDGKAHRRAVKLGLAEGPVVEVTEGLQAGTMVVTRGQQGLNDGDAVVVVVEEDARQ